MLDYTQITSDVIQTVLTLGVPVVFGYVVLFLRAHIGNKKTDEIIRQAGVIVGSINQLYASGQIPKTQRFGQAMDYMKQKFPGLDFATIGHYIENEVDKTKSFPYAQALTTLDPVEQSTANLIPGTPAVQTVQTPTI